MDNPRSSEGAQPETPPQADPPQPPTDPLPLIEPPAKTADDSSKHKTERHNFVAADFYGKRILGALEDGRIIYFQPGEGLVATGASNNETLLAVDSVEGVYPYEKTNRLVASIYKEKIKDQDIPEIEIGLIDATGAVVKTFGDDGWARLRTTESYSSVRVYDVLEMPDHEVAILWTSTTKSLSKAMPAQGHLTFLSEKGKFDRAVIFNDAELLEQGRLIIDGQQVVVVSLGTPKNEMNTIFRPTTNIRLRRFQIMPAKPAGDIVYGFLDNCNVKLDRGSDTMILALYQCESDLRLWGMRIDGQLARTSATKFALPFSGGVIYPSIVPLTDGGYALVAFQIHDVKKGALGDAELLGAKLNRDFTLNSWLIPQELPALVNADWRMDLEAEAFALGQGRVVFGEHEWHSFSNP